MDCLACHTPNAEGARFCAKCGAPLPAAQATLADPLIGQVVGGRYRITSILGEGGMGRVYTGEQQMGTSIRKVAVKTLLAQFAKDPQTVARFMREVGTVSELEHPNTVKVFDFGQIEQSGELYIAMELLSGQSLEDAILKGAMVPERVDRIIGQVCGALQEAHDKGIVHRDLKPANIFLTTRAGEEDVVKVLDFGIAKRGESRDSKTGVKEQKLTQQGTILGTPPYMSPEQFSAKELDSRSDLYSLGILTYEMLCGRVALDPATPGGWLNRHLSVQPFPFESTQAGANVPQKMKAAVMRALDKDRERRPSTAREFYDELTLGAVRMSLLAAHPSSPNLMPGGGTMALSSAQPGTAPSRAGGTMMGEPMFAGGPGHGPGMTADGAPMGGVPTGGGQVYATPPVQKSGNGAIIGALLGMLVLGGGGGAAWYFIKGPGHKPTEDTSATVYVPTRTAKRDADASSSSTGGKHHKGTTSGGESSTTGGTESSTSSSSSSTTGGGITIQPTEHPTSHPVEHHIDPGCCSGIKEMEKKKLCTTIVNGINSGKMPPTSIAGANAQGGHCRE